MITFGADLHDHAFARRKEFLLTAGDAYCSSSLAGNTRKYHGLFVAGRRVYISCLEEEANGERFSVHRYSGALQDEGLSSLYGFELYPPIFYYMVDGASIKKTIEFDGELTIRYDVEGETNLHIRPLITDRGYHETKRNVELNAACTVNGFSSGKLSIRSGLRFKEDPQTYYNVFYERDSERGYDHVEDLWSPGYFEGRVKDASVSICAAVDGVRKAPINRMTPIDPADALELAADSFLVDDTIYAGYHWFAEPWGRDTFVSVPGLLLERGRFEEAKRVFRHFARHIKNGLIPNRIPGGYNSSDAPLWFIYALGKYFEKRNDTAFYREANGYVESIMNGYPESEAATLDGSLISTAPETTWMDTRYTGRKGKAVEVNALWVNALEIAEGMGLMAPVKPVAARREMDRFWNEKKGCLYDVIDPYDDSVRPNQAIAIALGAIDGEKAKRAMRVIRKELLTPYGLRTLSPMDSRYIGRYSGDPSYHNGCVWPWLMGFYIEGALKVSEPKEKLRPLLEPLLLHTHDAGLGTISEIFDGDAPHEPNGCISQAWSVAEVIRARQLLKHAP
ncbi:putative amylo-alpha-1,6-glucosidase [Methanocella paludicola SANAE]|uniref:Amylo-alpha-1,6-glucosidase n=1 Tax=Methanocella paludicola (strain DSM 17711 / JCM 13418 / NBRC 101707 / SANAE) TaxID=304371 RepID=D1Z183_METPS|nr:amylo-alpha-1,6-glucosidase [Methanocella paludicola]BAI62455.1 putative amylo-alpha-1,6-glucosidase [Methanocella paludicola SANAE]